MNWLNYHHLRYFWSVAKEGSLRKAAEELGVSQPSISAQIRLLEESLALTLFRKSGRRMVLTDSGRMVFDYAEEIFNLGRDLLSAVRLKPDFRLAAFHVGLTDTLPKMVACDILKPALNPSHALRMSCHEGSLEDLLPLLASHRLDIIIADEPAPSSAKFKAFNHPLGSCGVTLCAAPAMARKLQQNFPVSLNQAAALLPSEHSVFRRALEKWFDKKGVRPQVMAEFDDPAMMSVFALDVEAFFPLQTVAVDEARRRYGFQPIAELEGCKSEFYAITADRKIKHPAILAVTENAQLRLFSPPSDATVST